MPIHDECIKGLGKQLMQDLAKMLKVLCPVLYYVTQENVERGRVYYATKTKFTPECVVCHPDDLEKIKGVGRPLVALREWRPVFLGIQHEEEAANTGLKGEFMNLDEWDVSERDEK